MASEVCFYGKCTHLQSSCLIPRRKEKAKSLGNRSLLLNLHLNLSPLQVGRGRIWAILLLVGLVSIKSSSRRFRYHDTPLVLLWSRKSGWMLECPRNKLTCSRSSHPPTGPPSAATVKHIYPLSLGLIDPADEGTLGCIIDARRRKWLSVCPCHLGQNLPVAQGTQWLPTSLGPLSFQIRSQFINFCPHCVIWVIGAHSRFSVKTWNLFGFQTWRADSLLSTRGSLC